MTMSWYLNHSELQTSLLLPGSAICYLEPCDWAGEELTTNYQTYSDHAAKHVAAWHDKQAIQDPRWSGLWLAKLKNTGAAAWRLCRGQTRPENAVLGNGRGAGNVRDDEGRGNRGDAHAFSLESEVLRRIVLTPWLTDSCVSRAVCER